MCEWPFSIEFLALRKTTHEDREISKGPDTDLRYTLHGKSSAFCEEKHAIAHT